jgi:uncharacterized protein YggT (Ycf19 family)
MPVTSKRSSLAEPVRLVAWLVVALAIFDWVRDEGEPDPIHDFLVWLRERLFRIGRRVGRRSDEQGD